MSQLSAAINLNILLPEITLLAAAFILLIFIPLMRQRIFSVVLSIIAVLVSLMFVVKSWNNPQSAYFGMVVCDNFSLFCKAIFLFTCGSVVMLSRDYLKSRGLDRPEYYAMLLISTTGMMFMVSSSDLMVIFIGLEIMSLPLYVLAGFLRDNLRSNEAAAKYFFMGAFASAFFLYGIALVYGGTGTTDLAEIYMSTGVAIHQFPMYFLIGAAMVLIGFAFKIASFPFHMWVPDVYQGAPTPITAFFSIGPKAAGVATLLRIFMIGFWGVFDTYGPLFWMLAFLTMTVGNILAVMQSDVKRMLAYSSIAHAGYLLVAVTAGSNDAVSAALFYLLAYSFFNMGAFAIITLIENKTKSNDIQAFRGLSSKHPWLAVLLALFMFSLAGFPPTAGFVGKFYVFSAAIKSGLIWLVVAAVINSLISVYYYLRPLKAAFFDRAEGDDVTVRDLTLSPLFVIVLILTGLGSLGLGIFPGYFIDLAAASGLIIL
ncbi:MAG: NADH-quinone oxidoreductase subunit N [candidate division Zixibacteria bacterium]